MAKDLTDLDRNNDFRFDLLKAIAITLIIFAHTKAPFLAQQFRNFDVPLIVIVGGALFMLSTRHKIKNYFDYLAKRFLRLVIPTWLGLGIIFGYTYLLFLIFRKPAPFALEKIVSSFFLLDGIGYVWIIRVFLILALLAPFLLVLKNKLHKKRFFLGVILLAYIAYEIIFFIFGKSNFGLFDIFGHYYLFFAIPYALLFSIGMCLPELKKNEVKIFTITSLLLLIAVFIYTNPLAKLSIGKFISFAALKTPPRLYFISYGLAISMLLYCIIYTWRGGKYTRLENAISFLGKSTLSLFMWHIFFLYNFNFWLKSYFPINTFIPCFIFIFSLSILAVHLQKKLLKGIIQTEFGRKHLNFLEKYC